jgi:glycosyltransferase involved in cell wall biosynthesis
MAGPVPREAPRLRVALIAGMLAAAGAEKQVVYAARALRAAGAEVRIYSLTRGQFYEGVLARDGLAPEWVGRFGAPPLRLAAIVAALSRFRPHIVQATHTFVNLYAAAAGRLLGALDVGVLTTSLAHAQASYGGWTRWLVSSPSVLLANSRAAQAELQAGGRIPPERIRLLPIVVDLAAFDQAARVYAAEAHAAEAHAAEAHAAEAHAAEAHAAEAHAAEAHAAQPAGGAPGAVTAIFVGRLYPVKRADRFLRGLALARREAPELRGLVAGEGPERPALERLAGELGLLPEGVQFLGHREDIAGLLARSDLAVLTSDDEGTPNVVVEALAAGLALITTPAGDAAALVREAGAGAVVPMDDGTALAAPLVELARAPEQRRRLGAAGRRYVEQHHAFERLGPYLTGLYREFAHALDRPRLLQALPPADDAATRC